MLPETLLLHAGMSKADQGEPFHSGPVFAAPSHAAGDPTKFNSACDRFHCPRGTDYEKSSVLAGGSAIVFASGRATVVFGSILPGDFVVVPAGSHITPADLDVRLTKQRRNALAAANA